ncbi:MAG: hypothetical protein IIA92_04370 [Chloroflexi bacterium]|nr:hypothetical protein [Chloroflexota bacterium]
MTTREKPTTKKPPVRQPEITGDKSTRQPDAGTVGGPGNATLQAQQTAGNRFVDDQAASGGPSSPQGGSPNGTGGDANEAGQPVPTSTRASMGQALARPMPGNDVATEPASPSGSSDTTEVLSNKPATGEPSSVAPPDRAESGPEPAPAPVRPAASQPDGSGETPSDAPAAETAEGGPSAQPPATGSGGASGDAGGPGGGMGGGGGESPEAVAITAEDPGGILEQLMEILPSSASESYAQAEAASATALSNQRDQAQEGLPEIPAPTGLEPSGEEEADQGGEAPASETPTEKFDGEQTGKEGREYETKVESAPSVSIRPTAIVGGGSSDPAQPDPELSRSAQNALEGVQMVSGQVSTSAGERPPIDLTGEADPAQMGAFQGESAAQVQEAQANAASEIDIERGESNIYPASIDKILGADYELASAPAPAGAPGGAPQFSMDSIPGFDDALAPHLRERIGEQKDEYDIGKQQYDADSTRERADADQSIEDLKQETRQTQIDEQGKVQAEVAASREQWRGEIEAVDAEYQAKASTATQEQTEKIATEKAKGEAKVQKHLADAETKAANEKTKAETKAAEKKEAAKKKSKGFWGWVKSAASALVEGLKSVVNAIYDGLRAAVKFIFEAAKFLVKGVIELYRMAVVAMIRVYGFLLKGLVSVVFFAFPEIRDRINANIDLVVDTAVAVVNKAAELLTSAVEAVLDFFADIIDKLLGLIQSIYNGIFTVIGMIVRGEFGELMERFGNLFEALKASPSHFETAAYEELLGGNLDEPLSPEEFMQAEKAVPGADDGGVLAEDAGPKPTEPFTAANVGVEQVLSNMELSPELTDSLMDITDGQGAVEFGESDDSSRSMAAVMAEAFGEQKEGGENEQVKYPDDGLTPRERAAIKWEMMKTGIAAWWSNNQVLIIGGAIAAIVGVIALIVATGGSVLAAIGPIMAVLGPLFIGLTVATIGGHVTDFVSKAWDGDIAGGAKSLAKALAAGAVELISYLTFKAGGAVLKGAKAAVKGGVKLAKGAAKLAVRGAKFVIKKGKILFKGLASSGVGKQFKRLRQLGDDLLTRLRFRKFRITMSGRWFTLEGFINPWIIIAEGKVTEVPKGTKNAEFKTKQELEAISGGGKPKTGAVTEFEVVDYRVSKASGKESRGVVRDDLTGDHIPSRAALVKAAEAETAKSGRTLTKAERTAIREEGVTVVLKGKTHADLSRTYGGRNKAAQIVADAADLGQAFRRDSEAILAGLKAQGKLNDEIVGAYLKAYRTNVTRGVFKFDGATDAMFMSFLK